MNDLFGAVVPDEHDELQQARVGFEPEAKLPLRVIVVQLRNEGWGLCSLDRIFLSDVVFER